MENIPILLDANCKNVAVWRSQGMSARLRQELHVEISFSRVFAKSGSGRIYTNLKKDTDFPPRTPKPGFFELIPYSPVYITPFSARGCRWQLNGLSAATLSTSRDIPCVYPSADFQRQPQTDEQHHHPHRNFHRADPTRNGGSATRLHKPG